MQALRVSLFFLLIGCLSFAQANEFSSLEERMSDTDFRAAGLDRLSAEELAALNNWLRGQLTTHNPAVTGDMRGFNSGVFGDRYDDDLINRIDGEFSGWNGKGDVFRLKNGQVWEQAESGTLNIGKLIDPEVNIEQSVTGSWYLRVKGYNKSVRVKRVR